MTHKDQSGRLNFELSYNEPTLTELVATCMLKSAWFRPKKDVQFENFNTILFLFIAVQRAYVELGNNDYMYSPAPIKPAYNDHHGRGGYYPTSPQHFQMDERK